MGVYVFRLSSLILVSVMMAALVSAWAQEYVGSSPVRLWGDFSSTYRTADSGNGEARAVDWLNSLSINASSYIWHPWFALINGGLTYSENETRFGGQGDSTNEFTTGNMQFNLFPASRFPFMLYYNKNRNILNDDLFGRDFTVTEYGFGQQYRTIDNRHQYRANYNRNRRSSGQAEDYLNESLLLSSSNRVFGQSFDTDLRVDTVENTAGDEVALSYALTGRHSYRQGNHLSIENLVSGSALENDFLQSTINTRSAQVSSLVSWQPDNTNKLNVTGSFRLSALTMDQDLDPTLLLGDSPPLETKTANINQGMIYRYSDQVTISESVNVNHTETAGRVTFIGSESLGWSYLGKSFALGGGDYGWSVGSNFNNQHGDTESQQGLSNRFSHSLTHNFNPSNQYNLRTSLSQGLGYGYQSSREEEVKSVDHAFSMTWSTLAARDQSTVRFSLSESRAMDEEERVLLLANLQYTGFFRVDRYSRLVGNVTLQQSSQEIDSVRSSSRVANGQLEYTNNRMFGVPYLGFKSQLKLNRQLSENEQFITAVTDEGDTGRSWENSLSYRVGRLSVELDLDIVKAGEEYDRLIRFQLKRTFGDL